MSIVYQKPPLIEAICEFRFEPSQPWDWTIPGLVYEKIKDRFPKKHQQNQVELQVQISEHEQAPEIKNSIDRMQFLSNDEHALIQVGPDLLSINQLKPYTNWHTFKAMVVHGLSVYREIAHPKGYQRIGLRYVNRIEVPESSIRIEDYLVAVPNIPEPIPQLFATWVQRVEIPYEQANGVMVLQSGNQHLPQQTRIVMLLDLDFVTLAPSRVSTENAMEWVENAHNEIENAFDACLTDKARELFEARKEVIQHG